jgi:uncharacterized protein YbjT (DUF2867 family)
LKYILTGGAGNITKPVARQLSRAGHEVVVISRSLENLTSISTKGITPAVGSVEDIDFLKKTFAGADAVYTMVPPNFAASQWKQWIGQIGKNYAEAIRHTDVKYVVNLSSIGAHLTDGVGPVSGLHIVENNLNELKDVNIRHLRPGYFFDNLLHNVNLVKHMNIIGSNFSGQLVLTTPPDIAEVVTEELSKLDFTGHSVRYIASDVRDTAEIAKAIGQAIDKPELPWIVFPDDQALQGMLQSGLPEEIAKNYVEMGTALLSGKMTEDYFKQKPASLGKTKLEDFSKIFAAAYIGK